MYSLECLVKWGWPPSRLLDLPMADRAAMIAFIDTINEEERKQERESRRASKHR